MTIDYKYVEEQTIILENWVKSSEGQKELKLDPNETAAFCKQYLPYFQLLSWTSANSFHSGQLENEKKKNANYNGPTPEVKRAVLRLRGLDLALQGRLAKLLASTDAEPMTAAQAFRLRDIFREEPEDIDPLRWANIFRSTMMAPEAIKRSNQSNVNSKDSVTWLHQWVNQDDLLEQLTLPLTEGSIKEEPIIKKTDSEKSLFLEKIRAALYQPAHFRHKIFNETIASGYKGVMTLTTKQRKLWFKSWCIDVVAFGNRIGEYMTKSMVARMLAVYDAMMNPNNNTAEDVCHQVENKFYDIALDAIPAHEETLLDTMAQWSQEEKILFVRLAGQRKVKADVEYQQLGKAMQEAGSESLKTWVSFYSILEKNPALPTPTFVPLLLEKMDKADKTASLSKVIAFAGTIVEHLLNQYQNVLPKLAQSSSSSSSSSTGLAGQQAQVYIETIKKLGPLNFHGIANDEEFLNKLLAHNNIQDLKASLNARLNLDWRTGANPTATLSPAPQNNNNNAAIPTVGRTSPTTLACSSN